MHRPPRKRIIIALLALGLVLLAAGCSMVVPADDETDGDGVQNETAIEDPSNESAGTDDPSNEDAGTDGPGNESAGDKTQGTTDGPDDDGVGSTTGPITDTGLPVDENRVYNQTRALLDSAAAAPTVSVRDLDVQVGGRDGPFFDLLGLTNDSDGDAGGTAAAIARGPDTVVVNEALAAQNGTTDDYNLELVFAHEFVHTIQFDKGWHRIAWAGDSVDRTTTDYQLLYRALLEGGAVFAAERYADRANVSASQVGRFEREYRAIPPEQKYAFAPYYHGSQYFDAALETTAGLGGVYEDEPPRTTAEILQPGRAVEPTPVEFSAESNREGWVHVAGSQDRTGAMFVHVAVSAHTDVATADEAAAGWANDRLFEFRNGETRSYAWATHWNSTTDADEFATAFTEAVAAREDDDADRVELRRTGNRTVVVLAGSQNFRRGVAIDGHNATLEVVLRQTQAEQTQRTEQSGHPQVQPGTAQKQPAQG